MRYETEKLIGIWRVHGKIVVGVDFDDTVFPFTSSKHVEDRCEIARNLLKELKEHISLCLYTVADEQSMVYKLHIMREYGLVPDFVNESPVQPYGKTAKPFFNILLDDKAGLNETLEILTEFKQQIL